MPTARCPSLDLAISRPILPPTHPLATIANFHLQGLSEEDRQGLATGNKAGPAMSKTKLQALFGAAGRPQHPKLSAKQQERKYFDSADYAVSKAGKGDGVDTGPVGSEHPVPENIPHLSSPVGQGPGGPRLGSTAALDTNGGRQGGAALHPPANSGGMQAGSPVKESSHLHRETSADEVDQERKVEEEIAGKPAQGSSGQKTGPIPIRR